MTIPDIHPDERIDEINEYISLILLLSCSIVVISSRLSRTVYQS